MNILRYFTCFHFRNRIFPLVVILNDFNTSIFKRPDFTNVFVQKSFISQLFHSDRRWRETGQHNALYCQTNSFSLEYLACKELIEQFC